MRNLPDNKDEIEGIIQLKPTALLAFIMIGGILVTVLRPYMVLTGVSMILLAVFAMSVMPDGKLCQIRKNYLVLYNNVGTDLVTLVYWDEIVDWHYEWRSSADFLVITLIDGSTETQEMFSRMRIARALRQHAPDKEKRRK